MVYCEYGRYPLEIIVKMQMIKYWCKLLSGKNTKIPCIMYKLLYYMYKKDIYKSKWISKIENIVQETGLNYAWLNNEVGNINNFCKTVNTRLQCQCIQNWNADVLIVQNV